jgi:hypothetical protein
MRFLIGALVVAAMAGCSSDAINISQTTAVPADEVYAFQSRPSGPSGQVTVMRDGGVYGAGCDVVVYVNGKRAAKLGTSERVTFYLPAGAVSLGVGLTETGLCTGAVVRTIAQSVSAGGEKRYRISSDINGWVIEPYAGD